MTKIKILECTPSSSGIAVKWQILDENGIIDTLYLNFDRAISESVMKKNIGKITRKHLEKLQTIENNNPVTLENDLNKEILLEDFEGTTSVEVLRLQKTEEISRTVGDFLQRKSDKNSRYEIQYQIATLASLISILEKLRNENLTENEIIELKTKYNKIVSVWNWMENVFLQQISGKIQIENANENEIENISLNLTPLELSDPDVYLQEIWDKLELIEV